MNYYAQRSRIVKSNAMTATKLRLVLAGTLFLIIAGHIGATVLGQYLLQKNSQSVTETVSLEQSSKETLSNLQRAETLLQQQKETVEKSRRLFADSVEHNYQAQVIKDINAYATLTGIRVKGFTFSDDNTAPANGAAPANSSAAPSASAPTPGASTAAPTTGEQSGPLAGNIKTTTVTVNLESPIEYETFLKFIKLVQNNLTQFRIQTLSLSSGSSSLSGRDGNQGAGPRMIDIPSLTMEIYTKQ